MKNIKKCKKDKAEKYVAKVEKGKQEKGLTYLSAKDFLKHHKQSGKIINI